MVQAGAEPRTGRTGMVERSSVPDNVEASADGLSEVEAEVEAEDAERSTDSTKAPDGHRVGDGSPMDADAVVDRPSKVHGKRKAADTEHDLPEPDASGVREVADIEVADIEVADIEVADEESGRPGGPEEMREPVASTRRTHDSDPLADVDVDVDVEVDDDVGSGVADGMEVLDRSDVLGDPSMEVDPDEFGDHDPIDPDRDVATSSR